MRITDVALSTSTPVGTARTGVRRDEPAAAAPRRAAQTESVQHPDELAAAALQRAAGAAQALRVVAAQNQRAADSARAILDRLLPG